MTEVRRSVQALEDVESIRQYVSRDSVEYARLLVARNVQSVERLAEYSTSRRVVPELGDESVRETICGDYRVVYQYSADSVVIPTVHHGARLLRFD